MKKLIMSSVLIAFACSQSGNKGTLFNILYKQSFSTENHWTIQFIDSTAYRMQAQFDSLRLENGTWKIHEGLFATYLELDSHGTPFSYELKEITDSSIVFIVKEGELASFVKIEESQISRPNVEP